MAYVDPVTLPQVAVAFMNDDHRAEARLLNDISEALEALREGRGGKSEVDAAWRALTLHMRAHFDREEQAMSRAKYPGYDVHRSEHKLMLAAMDAEARAFEVGGDADCLARYVESAMPAWLVHHIEATDSATAEYLAQHTA